MSFYAGAMTSYRSAVEPVTSSVARLMDEILADLDEAQGGIGWWRGYVGWQVSAELGEYLLSACGGVSEALIKASLAIQEYRESSCARDHALTQAWRAIAKRGGSRDELIGAQQALGDAGQRREDRLDAWLEQTIVSLGQALDRVAAVIVIVAGIKCDVIRTDWGELQKVAVKALKNGRGQGLRQGVLADVGTSGRERQNALLSDVLKPEDHGPEDWLSWLIAQRNTMVHRAPRMSLIQMVGTRARPTGVINPLPSQPDWVGTRAMIDAGKAGTMSSMFLVSTPQTVLEGLRGSMCTFLDQLLKETLYLWGARRSDPRLIVQPGGSWQPVPKSGTLSFPGYGEPASMVTKEIAVHPSMGRRLRAARLMDDQVHLW